NRTLGRRSSMTETPSPSGDPLSELLFRWEQHRRQGLRISPEELCREHPELVDEVSRRVAVLEAFDRALPVAISTGPYTALDEAAAERPPVVPGYTIVRRLGQGGMGVVYQATETNTNRTVALKVISARANPRPLQRLRFQIEAEAAAALQHPNIV